MTVYENSERKKSGGDFSNVLLLFLFCFCFPMNLNKRRAIFISLDGAKMWLTHCPETVINSKWWGESIERTENVRMQRNKVVSKQITQMP